MESNGTENNWKKAFEGAEAAPSEGVWNSIESGLVAAENKKMKRSVFFYQRLAAACVVFALLAGGYAFYSGSEVDKTKETAITKQQSTEKYDSTADANHLLTIDSAKSLSQTKAVADASSGKSDDDKIIPQSTERTEHSFATKRDAKSSTSEVTPDEKAPLTAGRDYVQQTTDSNQSVASGAIKRSSGNELSNSNVTSKQLLPLIDINQIIGINQNNVVLNRPASKSTNQQMIRLPQYKNGLVVIPPMNESLDTNWNNLPAKSFASNFQSSPLLKSDSSTQKKNAESPIVIKPEDAAFPAWAKQEEKPKISDNESFWGSVGGSAGIYNMGGKSNSTSDAKGPAYTFGVAVAGKVFPRWVVQGGVNYINQSATNSSALNASVVGPPTTSTADYNNYADAFKASATGTYSANSMFEFVSVPMQAGYLVVDHKFGFLVNAGVAPNIFVRNSLVDNSGRNDTFSTGAGDASPYKTISWSGLVNTELSWKLARQYRFALVPGMRYALNPLTKTGSDRPYAIDLGFRVRYSFY